MNSKLPTLLIDGDQYLYKSSVSNEVEINWGDDLWTLHSDAREAWAMLNNAVYEIQKELESYHVVFCLSDEKNFRKDVYPEYKSKRKDTRKPLAYHELKQWVMQNYEYAIFPRCEADDVMGILATQKDANCIIVSDDKDMKTVPARLYRQGELTKIDDDEADDNMWLQALTGDPTDGYPGCKGYGAVKAAKLLSQTSSENRWKAVLAAFQKEGFDEEYALAQLRCARILRASDFDMDTKQLTLWTPK